MKISQLSEEYLFYIKNINRFSINTSKAYSEDLSSFINYCNKYEREELSLITDKFLKSYLMTLSEEGLNKNSISRKLSSLRGVFKFAFNNNYIDHNPTVFISNPKSKRKLPEVVTTDSILEVYNEAKIDKNYFLIVTIFEILYGCALRVSELCNLKVMDVDIKQQIIRVKGKGGKTRIVPLGNKSKEIVKNYLKTIEPLVSDAPLFQKKGKALYPKYVYRIVNKYLSKVTDVKKKSPHVLRHSAATHMLDNGADLRAVKEILGHENLSTTQIYTHVSVERLKSAYRKAHPKS